MERFLLWNLILLLLIGCSNQMNIKEDIPVTSIMPNIKHVEVYIIDSTYFKEEIQSNGKIKTAVRAQLSFGKSGRIISKEFNNGDNIKSGSIIAQIENQQELLELEKAREELNSAKLELNSIILGFGGKTQDTNSIPIDILQKFKIQSGYNKALLNLKQANMNLQSTYLISPIDGIISDFALGNNEEALASEIICQVLANDEFIVEFKIHELDLFLINPKQKLCINPYNNKRIFYEGYINSINPVVDKHGFVKIEGLINKSNQDPNLLLDGMNVKVTIVNEIDNSIVIPKNAVVKRNNKDIVFSYHHNRAKWHNIEIGGENTDHYYIKEGLKHGDTIIVSGNINLTHQQTVKAIIN